MYRYLRFLLKFCTVPTFLVAKYVLPLFPGRPSICTSTQLQSWSILRSFLGISQFKIPFFLVSREATPVMLRDSSDDTDNTHRSMQSQPSSNAPFLHHHRAGSYAHRNRYIVQWLLGLSLLQNSSSYGHSEVLPRSLLYDTHRVQNAIYISGLSGYEMRHTYVEICYRCFSNIQLIKKICSHLRLPRWCLGSIRHVPLLKLGGGRRRGTRLLFDHLDRHISGCNIALVFRCRSQ